MMRDITKRLIKKGFKLDMPSRYGNRDGGRVKQQDRNENEDNRNKGRKKLEDQDEEYLFRLKLTLLNGFIEHFLKVREPTLDDKQEKRLKFMKR